jgi:acetylglutamate kinase
MKEKITVIKVGGKIVEESESLGNLLDRFAAIGGRKVLIHGGGRSATRMAERLGIESRMVDGRRITDSDTLQVVTMVYGGLVNKNIVAQLQARGINALGLTGADCNIIKAHKRPVKEIDYGFVGDVECADGAMLARLVEQGITPIVAPLTHDGKGNLLNTNADTMAAETAKALAVHYDVTLIYCFELPGVMRDPEDAESLIPTITRESYSNLLADGTVSGGMIPKIDNAFNAIENGVMEVIITRADAIDGVQGTHIIA